MTIPGSGFMMDNEASCLPCTPEEEKRVIDELTRASDSNRKEGDVFYVLSNKWYIEWQNYVGREKDDFSIDEYSTSSHHSNGVLSNLVAQRPGAIDNFHLVLNGNLHSNGDELELIRNLEEGRDYVLVSEEVWKKFHQWYKGGPAIHRKLISQGIFHKTLLVEVYPLCLQLIDARDNSKRVIRLSKKASIRELYNKVSTLLQLVEKVRIWDYFNQSKQSFLNISDQTLEDVNLQIDQEILLELEHDGYWPSGYGMDSTGNGLALVPLKPSRSSVTIAGGLTLSNGCSTGYVSNLHQGSNSVSSITDLVDGYDNMVNMKKADRGGLAGLQNLGNTCFMNSALQCLLHTPPLVEYFLQDYSEEINKQNPIGMHGELAIAFGELLRKLWSSGRAPIAPRAFKGKLARFAPQFSGYNQHDSHELLAFLLDGLHEDLNRVKFKPYIDSKDANDRPDEEVANECWEIHKARNDSVIVDVCQGQYKSTLVCPNCNKVSITFDPFMYLSLPLPSTVLRTMTITVLYGDGSALPKPYTVKVLKNGYCKDLLEALSTECCLRSDESLLLAEVYDHKIDRYLEHPYESLSMIKDEEHYVAYRLPKKREGLTKLETIHQRKEKCTFDTLRSGRKNFLGTPLVTCLGEGQQTGADLQNAVHRMLTPFFKTKPSDPLNHIYTSKENNASTTGSDVDGLVNSCNSESGVRSQFVDEMEIEQTSNGMLDFQLALTDEKVLSCSPIENDLIIGSGHVRVLLEWSDKEHDMYNVSYLENLPEVCKPGYTVKKTRQEAISLFSCLEAFLKEEPLGPDDMWYCPTCKEHRQATKKLDLWRLPDILVVHLKRFSYSRYSKNKLDTFVNFPIRDLDLSKYVKSSTAASQAHAYELYAISNHYGGLGGGHYSAYAKLMDGDRWYHFDDSHVSPINEDEIKTSAAYVLFYQRVKERRVGESSQVNYLAVRKQERIHSLMLQTQRPY